ncbi:MAG: mucoidy inhibitor MuiA family protein [Nitrospiraceae bacterium]|nr:MAG: mucoidy inhibitor MuiA family protein [Nitrospiraceae bacterium]
MQSIIKEDTMNRRPFLCLSAFFLITAASLFISPFSAGPLAAEPEPGTVIQKVTVYSDVAMIKKEARTSLKKGEYTISLSGFPQNLLDGSLHTGISGSRGARISNVSVEETYLKKQDTERIQKLTARLDSLNEQISSASNEIAAINSSIEFLKKTGPFPQNTKASAAEITGHAEFLEQTVSAYLDRAARTDTALKKLKEQREAVEKEISEQSLSSKKDKTVIVHLISDRDVPDAVMTFSYLAKGAGWSPQYEIRADSTSGSVDLSSFAVIRQATGEDWKNVNIELSTAKPSVGGAVPEISPWYIDEYRPAPSYFQRLERRSMTKGIPEMDMMEYVEEGPEMPEVSREATSVTFALPGRIDVMSDNKPYKSAVSSKTIKTDIIYRTVPRLSQNAFLSAVPENPFDYPLSAGPMSVFLDGRFISSSAISATVLPGATFQVSLGIDEDLKVEWRNTKKFTESAGMFSKNTVMLFEYETILTNSKNRGVSIEVRDALPVSRNEKIKVDVRAPAGGEASVTDEGIILWDLNMGSSEKKKLKTEFRVEFPKELRVQGLE